MEEKKDKGKFNTLKRILAILTAALLVLLYVMTLVFAITDNPQTMGYFKASVALTIFIPVFIYAYQLVFRVVRQMGSKEDGNNK